MTYYGVTHSHQYFCGACGHCNSRTEEASIAFFCLECGSPVSIAPPPEPSIPIKVLGQSWANYPKDTDLESFAAEEPVGLLLYNPDQGNYLPTVVEPDRSLRRASLPFRDRTMAEQFLTGMIE